MTIRCHFNGKVIVPDEPIDLPINEPLAVTIENSATFVDPPKGKPLTAKELANSRLVGIWANRKDIRNSTEFAQELRRRAGRRGGGK